MRPDSPRPEERAFWTYYVLAALVIFLSVVTHPLWPILEPH